MKFTVLSLGYLLSLGSSAELANSMCLTWNI